MTPSRPPPALPRPEAPPPTPEQEKLAQQQQQDRISYGMVFESVHGKIVLADLKRRYGWDGDIERPSFRPGMSHADCSFTEGMKEPVRHILAMIAPIAEKPATKPTTATTS